MASHRRARPTGEWAEFVDYEDLLAALLDLHARGRRRASRARRGRAHEAADEARDPKAMNAAIAEIADALAISVWLGHEQALEAFRSAARSAARHLEERVRLDRGASSEVRAFARALFGDIEGLMQDHAKAHPDDPRDDLLIQEVATLCAQRFEGWCVLPENDDQPTYGKVLEALRGLKKRRSNAAALVLTALRSVGLHEPNLLKATAMERSRARRKKPRGA